MKDPREWHSTDDAPLNNGWNWLDEEDLLGFGRDSLREEDIDENENCFDNENE